MIVGHMPFLSKLASFLVYEEENKESFLFSPGSVLCLGQIENEGESHQFWNVQWMINSELINL